MHQKNLPYHGKALFDWTYADQALVLGDLQWCKPVQKD